MSIKKHTVMTSRQAIDAYENSDFRYTGYQRILFGEYENILSIIEHQQNTQAQNLLNRKGVQSDSWFKVMQLVEDLTFNDVSQQLREQLADIETKLKNSGAFNERLHNDY